MRPRLRLTALAVLAGLLPLQARSQAGVQEQVYPVQAPQRLSSWLNSPEGQARLPYDSGLIWISKLEQTAAIDLRSRLRQALQDYQSTPLFRLEKQDTAQRLNWLIDRLGRSGRVVLPTTQADYLRNQPSQDPVLQPGDQVISVTEPKTVSVLLSNGRLCQVQYQPGLALANYLTSCESSRLGGLADPLASPSLVGEAYLIQPTGQVHRVRILPATPEDQRIPMAGAWIWAPDPLQRLSREFDEDLAQLLAQQGPAPASLVGPLIEPVENRSSASPPPISLNDYGLVGLMQLPTARMAPAGTVAVSTTRVAPYRRFNVFLTPFDGLEAGFRYTDIEDRLYSNIESFSGSQSYKDKSIDLKLRLLQETPWLPELSIGLTDIGGTGLFSSEYLIGTKRWGNLDFSLGLGWGYLAKGSSLTNPLSVLSSGAKARPMPTVGQGGEFSGNTYFRGPVGVLAGLQWQTPISGLSLKLEREANRYRNEPLGRDLPQDSPYNIGLSYALSNWAQVSLGYERGNRLMFGLSLLSPIGQSAPRAKVLGPQPPLVQSVPLSPSPAITEPSLPETTLADVEQLSLWRIRRSRVLGDTAELEFEQTNGLYLKDRAELIARILHRDLPQQVRRFRLLVAPRGLAVTELLIDRNALLESATQLRPTVQTLREPVILAQSPEPEGSSTRQDQQEQPKEAAGVKPLSSLPGKGVQADFSLSPAYAQQLGGPDGFVLFQVALSARGEIRLQPNTWLQGTVNYRLIDNYDNFKLQGTGKLPLVRSLSPDYYRTSRTNIPNLQLTHVEQLPDLGGRHFVSAYGGLLEWMFAGVGVEYLYRPWGSPVSIGFDINQVQQRGFEQQFSFRDYKTTTGHLSLYWETGFRDLQAELKIGRYLARDKGATLAISRVFRNGIVMGAYATKTNVSAADFGEGSFDKGVYLTIPFDAILPLRSTFTGSFVWQPITRDGGAILGRGVSLQNLTGARSPRALTYGSTD